jgi:ParB family chromosome partitioning protein
VQIDITQIVIRKRIRKNLGDLSTLMESMREHGLLNPVVITNQNELVAGHRRTEAAKRLGWKNIEVRVVDAAEADELLEMEIEENTERKQLTSDELADGYMRLDKLRNPPLLVRIWRAIVRFFTRIFSRKKGRKRT